MWRYGKVLSLNKVWSLLAIVFLVCNSYIVSWSVYGLETPLFLALMLWFFQFMQEYLKDSSRKNLMLLVLTGVAFAIVRPEAPFYLLVSVCAVLVLTPPISDIKSRVLKSLLPGAIIAGILVALLCLRYAYFGQWFPQTYFAKRGAGFHLSNLDALYAQGVGVVNLTAIILGELALIWLLIRRKDAILPAIVIACQFFVAMVIYDWMPNGRHLLPVWVILPLALAALGNALWNVKKVRWLTKTAAVAIALLMLATSANLAQIDSHFSKMDINTHGHGTEWKRPKTMQRWQESYSNLRREMPPRVKGWNIRGGGMIEQVWNVLEACTEPLNESWYIGRDIGRVGYLTDVNIFDTDALFTPMITNDPEWRDSPENHKKISTKLVGKMMEKFVIGTEVYGGWAAALGRQKDLPANFEVLSGSQKYPSRITRISCDEPTHGQLVRRYTTVFDRMPQNYYVATLYGDSVGAMIERRYRYIMRTAENPPSGLSEKSAIPADYPKDAVLQNISFDGVARLEFCRELPRSVRADEGILFDCYYSSIKKPASPLKSFVHLVEGGKITARNIPLGTRRLPFTSWSPEVFGDKLYHQVSRLIFVPAIKPGEYQILFGWYNGNHRAVTDRPELTDTGGRIIVKKITITP